MPLFDVYPLYDVTPVRAKGVHVYGADRKKYLDLYGGHAVISIGHQHPVYNRRLKKQISKIGFYSNAIQNPLQKQLADEIEAQSGCEGYQLFMCSSGAEANENALKLASFYNKKAKVVAFKNAFHGRTSAAVAATDTPKIIAPLNAQQEVIFLDFGDEKALEETLANQDVCAVIIEAIQGVGGLDMPTKKFMKAIETLCRKYNSCLIADEVQSGFGRSGAFFAYQHFGITPDIISMAKGMGNGFPVGGIFVHPKIEPWYGMLGTTFGGNHLACQASLAVLEVLKKKNLMENAASLGEAFEARAKTIKAVKKVKGRGLMLGLEFDFEVSELRKKLIYEHRIFTGGSSNKKLLRILPPLTIQQKHFDYFFNALEKSL